MPDSDPKAQAEVLSGERWLWIGMGTALLFAAFSSRWLADLSNPLAYALLFGWLFLTMLSLAFGVVRHADSLAILLGEPYGTLILTLSVISIDPRDGAEEVCTDQHGNLRVRSLGFHVVFLPLTMLPIVLRSNSMAVLIDYGIASTAGPTALGGFLVAVLVLAPEGVAAVKSAMANRLQRTVNIALGSSLSTIGLTVPAVLGISLYTGRHVELGLDPAELYLLLLTLLVSIVNLSSERTNVLHGVVHLTLFLTYVVLIFD